MYRNQKVTNRKGIGVIEAVFGVSIAALILLFVAHSIVRFVNSGKDVAEKTQALYLAEDALELVRFLRDEKWSNVGSLTDGTTYYLLVSSTTVATSTTPENIQGFSRSFVVDNVERDGNDDIVASGTEDPDSKYVTATVSWGNPTTTVTLTTILADITDP